MAFIDDRSRNLEGWLAVLQPLCGDQAVLSGFLSVDAFEEALADDFVPDVLFTDYFIEDRNGFEVIELVRAHFGDRVYLIAHSAEAWANKLMLKEGVDEAIPKFEDQIPSTPLYERFWCFDDLLELKKA